MKYFNFNVDIGSIKLGKDELDYFNVNGQRRVFEEILNQAVNNKYPQGLGGKEQRILLRILNTLDTEPGNCIGIEDADFEFFKGCFADDVLFPVRQTRLIALYKKNLEDAEGVNTKE